MEVYDQFVDPSAVTHSLACHLTSRAHKDLVVVKNTAIQVFSVASDKLVLQHEFKLQGQVLNIEKVKIKGSPLDSLVVLTKFAKVSVVSFDQEKHAITTNSLHFYEHEFKKRHVNEITESQLRVDPEGKVSLCFHKDILAFVALNSDDDLDMEDDAFDETFASSIITPSTTLDSEIHDIVDCSFLHNYREPTLAIIYNKSLTWAPDLSQTKDTVSFVVLNLDLSTGSSTPIINVDSLPYDIWKIAPLPFGGTLLVGCNELIHVDNSGNCKGIGVNEYYKDCTDFKLEDNSELDLFLEDCVLETIGSQVIISDKNNRLFSLTLERDGRTIKTLQLYPISMALPFGSPSSMTYLNDSHLFIGSSTTDSLLLKRKVPSNGHSLQESQQDTQDEPEKAKQDEKDEDDDDDDLYGDTTTAEASIQSSAPLEFEITDSLLNNGPISSFTLGSLSPEEIVGGVANPNYKDVSIIATSGEDSSGKITCFRPTIQPTIHSSLKFQNINKSWNLLDKYLVTTDLSNLKSEIFLISNNNFSTFQTLDFRNSNVTVNIAAFPTTQRIVQVTSKSVYLFDYNFRKVMQFNTEFEIINAKLYDPYIILTSPTGALKIFEVDPKGRKWLKVKLPTSLEDIITFGTICNTKLLGNSFGTKRTSDGDPVSTSNPVFLVTTVHNQVLAFTKEHNNKVFILSDIYKLPEISDVKEFQPTPGLVPDPFIKEIEIMEMGDSHHREEIMTLLTIGGEVIMYRVISDTKLQKLDSNIFTGAPENIFAQATIIERKLIPFILDDVSYLFVTGKQPYVIIKTRFSTPKIFKFTHTSLISICQYEGKFMAIDEDEVGRICSIPIDETHDYSFNLPIEIYKVGQTVNNVAFHETSNLLVVSTLSEIPYYAKDEEGEDIVGSEEKRKATSFKCYVKLIKPTVWITLDEVEFENDTVINSLKSLNLTISSRSKKKKEFIVFGTGKYRLEDLTVLGEFHIYDPISIVPDPEHPQVDYKLKEIVKEVVKGAVTSVSEISGRFLVSQGQKIIIRDLQQDNSTVPVAFLDTATYLSDSKSFENLVLVGDTLKNVWFLGFDAEPYRLLVLGKSLNELDVSACDFLVSNGEVFFLVADDEGTLHLIAYDPDDVKSLSGQRLLNKTTLHINTMTTTMRMIAKHEVFKEGRSFQIIGANVDGSLFKVTPIDEYSYRRLYILQQQLSEKLDHHCGLNPRANRYHFLDSGIKPIIDYELIRRFFYLNVEKRLQFSGKVGKNAYLEIWKDIIEIENSMNNLHA